MAENNNFKVDFLGIGVHRSASSWIYQCLTEHPQICAASKKELQFLDDPKKCGQGIEAYAAFFSHCEPGKIKGEYTPNYLASPYFNHEFVKKYFPNVKFIVCLRNPIERAHSHYIYHKTAEKVTVPFEKALKGEMSFYYLDIGLYYSQLKKWFSLYPRENFLILIYEDIAKNPLEFIQRIFRFLKIDPNFVPASFKEPVNWSAKNIVKVPFVSLFITKTKKTLYTHSKIFKPLVFMLKIFKIDKFVEEIRQANFRKNGLKPYERTPMQEKTRQYLREFYKEEIKNLEKLINRNLSFWI